ncbi:NACHT domain-containing protein [Umezawaea tangerina]|uniref:NACHT domain-containing protein n=1 Tax=Umezawaea tangerina TaxID=84725 RepID=A0A2T0SMJ1_9PSEU|nr:AAA family ATPase [Umezawaea tangerina]PRY34606.1 NACHT domain-containing protein [Umezawaea tangerina]
MTDRHLDDLRRTARAALPDPLGVVGTAPEADLAEAVRADRGCVLLGEPGSGRTTLLHRLAAELLEDGGPVPIVLSLSTGSWRVEPHRLSSLRWASAQDVVPADDWDTEALERAQRLSVARLEQVDHAVDTAVEWLSTEVGRLYRVPPRRVADWLRADPCPVVLLLDGLDEIRHADDRRRCVEVLTLLRTRLTTAIVVCARPSDEVELRKFGQAVRIPPLSAAAVDTALAADGLESLRAACLRHDDLVALLDTPLALALAVEGYRGEDVTEDEVRRLLAGGLDHLWAVRLPARASSLRGLARLMDRGDRDVFTVQALNLSWVRQAGLRTPRAVGPWVYAALALAAAIGLLAFTTRATDPGFAVLCAAVLAASAAAQVYSAGNATDRRRSRLDLGDFVATRWSLDWRSAATALLTCVLAGLVTGASVGMFGGAAGIALGLLPGTAAGLAVAVLTLPTRAPAARTRPTASRWTLAVRVAAGLTALALGLLPAFAVLALVERRFAPYVHHLMLAATVGVWLAAFAVSLHGWWSHRVAVKAVTRAGVLPADLAAFVAEGLLRAGPDGYAFGHPTLRRHLARD